MQYKFCSTGSSDTREKPPLDKLPTITKYVICTCLLLALLSPSTSNATSANAKPVYQIGNVIFPPYIVRNSKGELTGDWMDSFYQIMTKAELEYEFTQYPVARFYKHLLDGKIDISIVSKNIGDQSKVLLLSKQPISKLDVRLFWMPGTITITELSQLKNHAVVIMRGYQYGGILEELQAQNGTTEQLIQVTSHEEAIQMLTRDRAHYFLGYWRLVDYLVKTQSRVQLDTLRLAEIPLHVSVHNTVDNAKGIIEKLDQAIFEMNE